MSEMNEAICDEVKQRMRRVTARHKGYEQFGNSAPFEVSSCLPKLLAPVPVY